MLRKYTSTDLEYLQQQDFVASLELQYHKDVITDTAMITEDKDGVCHGVVYLKEHFSYSSTTEELHRVIPCIYTDEDASYEELLQYAMTWCEEYAKQHPEKKVCLATWLDDEIKDLQLFMHHGFMEYLLCPCLQYKLDHEIEKMEVPDGMFIKKLEFTPNEVDEFIAATGEANEGTPDSANELWFRQGGGTNYKALRLYQSLGFELLYNQIEMIYLPIGSRVQR